MKIINYGDNYEIYSDNMVTYENLPVGTYKVVFNPLSGFAFLKISDFQPTEEKIYGSHLSKVHKVFKSFDHFNRSLGVILSGDKGMGKSLSVQLMANEAIKEGMPVIMVTEAYKGIASFLEKIDQKVLVIFDEFEKTFKMDDASNEETQHAMLGLFDGTSQKKHLYAITVNKIYHLSEYMLNRTGRFHYHFRFDYPSADEIKVYLQDNVNPLYHSEIKNVVTFANRVKMNYDNLRAVAFELNLGYPFGEAISDLNILNTDAMHYNVQVQFSDGSVTSLSNEALDLFSDSIQITTYNDKGNYFETTFAHKNIHNEKNHMFVKGEDVLLTFHDEEELNTKVTSIVIEKAKDSGVNYKFQN